MKPKLNKTEYDGLSYTLADLEDKVVAFHDSIEKKEPELAEKGLQFFQLFMIKEKKEGKIK